MTEKDQTISQKRMEGVDAVFRHIIDKVPDYKYFMTVEELDQSTLSLAAQYPQQVEVFEAGTSTNGHPIYCQKIGNGSRSAVLYGCPHPNEPVGAMMLDYLAKCLAEDHELREKLDYTWYIVKCSDPDGTKLNENWFKGPFTLEHYARSFYRPSAQRQVDWSFPIQYKNLDYRKPISETQALMCVIDRAKPDFLYPLHNSGFGGAYWYMSASIPALNEVLGTIPGKYGIPLSLGESEAPYSEVFGPAIYKTLSMRDEYDYLEKYTDLDPAQLIQCGTCGLDYAIDQTEGSVFGFVTEVPYFYDPRIEDTTETKYLKSELLLQDCIEQKERYTQILERLKALEGSMSEENRFCEALSATALGALSGLEAKQKHVGSNVAYQTRATVSEEFEYRYVSKFYLLLSLGLQLRMLSFEKDHCSDHLKLGLWETELAQAQHEFSDLCHVLEQGMDYSAIPIQKLVKIQLECGLVIANGLSGKQSKAC